jgi:hypothetical protein
MEKRLSSARYCVRDVGGGERGAGPPRHRHEPAPNLGSSPARTFALNEVREVGDHVVVLARFHGRGRASGAEVDIPIGVVGKVRERKIAEARMFSDPDEALEAAGLGKDRFRNWRSLLALSGSWNLSAVLGELIHEPDRVISGRVSSLSQRA